MACASPSSSKTRLLKIATWPFSLLRWYRVFGCSRIGLIVHEKTLGLSVAQSHMPWPFSELNVPARAARLPVWPAFVNV